MEKGNAMTYNRLSRGVRRALLTSLLATPALAVQAQAQHPPPAPPEAVELDRIVVTAQSREQELKDVPIALQVVGENVIE